MARRVTRHDGLSAAERMRRHREAFAYGVAHGISLREAEKAVARQRCARMLASLNGRQAKPAATATPPINAQPGEANQPWWMKD